MWLHLGLDHECKGAAPEGNSRGQATLDRSALNNEFTFQCNLASYGYARLLSNSLPSVRSPSQATFGHLTQRPD